MLFLNVNGKFFPKLFTYCDKEWHHPKLHSFSDNFAAYASLPKIRYLHSRNPKDTNEIPLIFLVKSFAWINRLLLVALISAYFEKYSHCTVV